MNTLPDTIPCDFNPETLLLGMTGDTLGIEVRVRVPEGVVNKNALIFLQNKKRLMYTCDYRGIDYREEEIIEDDGTYWYFRTIIPERFSDDIDPRSVLTNDRFVYHLKADRTAVGFDVGKDDKTTICIIENGKIINMKEIEYKRKSLFERIIDFLKTKYTKDGLDVDKCNG